MKKTLKYLLLTAFSGMITAQKLDVVALSKIGNQLIAEELKSQGKKYDGKDNCVRDDEGNTLSCFSAESNPKWVSDFNNDGNPDAVFQFTDEGLGGGGNAFGYEYRIVLLDKNQKIKDQQSFFGGGKMSYANLSIDAVKNGRIWATYEENPYGNINYNENITLKTVALSFILENGKVVEESYKSCPLSTMKKQIFQTDKGYPIDRTISLDDQFNEELSENIELPNNVKYKAILSGCEDLEIYFTRTIPFRQDLKNDKTAIKKVLLENMQILQENTVFSSVIQSAYTELRNTKNTKLIEPNINLKLKDNWKTSLFVSGNQEQGSFITLIFTKSSKTEELNFWESLKHKKKLKTTKGK